MMGIQFKHSGSEKVAEFSYNTDESIKLTTAGCILFNVILLFLVDIFDVVFSRFLNAKIRINHKYRFFKKDFN